ncbi:uroporphyrinogen-III C-methyltransferase [Ammoniphilus sp. 3BR4]|uniref:uroporphyrinogen-III C-methyltransferase n=1 Tax=Ammoniphilus sp. 3BR4 TaxID=3158265 RepID=UPI003466A9D6
MKGKVYLVGAGPGDPKLITVKGLECIQAADVIIYDRLANPLLLEHRKEEAELIYCGKLPHHHTLRQEAINQLLVEKALEGKIVTRLKGGDPCVFGRVGEEAEELANNGIEFEIVPGVTSGIAVPAYAGIPVTHRDYGSTFAMVTGHLGQDKDDSEERWMSLAQGIDTISFYMGVANLPHICSQLIKYGRRPDTPVAVIAWGTMPQQTTVIGTLSTIQEIVEASEISNPAIILVGEVVKLREKIKWFQENRESVPTN